MQNNSTLIRFQLKFHSPIHYVFPIEISYLFEISSNETLNNFI